MSYVDPIVKETMNGVVQVTSVKKIRPAGAWFVNFIFYMYCVVLGLAIVFAFVQEAFDLYPV